MGLDEYTQNALFESVSNLIRHQKSHKFKPSQTMKINFYQKTKYNTQPLPFYDDNTFEIVCAEHEVDDVCKYSICDGTAYKDMECDDDRRHHNFLQNKDNKKPLLQLQYLSIGCLSNAFYKTHPIKTSNEWYFDEYRRANEEDAECTLIAFNSYGQHLTSVYTDDHVFEEDDESDRRKQALLDSVAYINDVSYLAQYAVRRGYNKYGAVAYFDRNLQIIAIHTYWDKKIWSKPRRDSDSAYLSDWEYAKWCWKTSVIVSSHLKEWTIKCRFIEINAFVQSVQKYLEPNHAIRRLFKPFMYGTVSANNFFC